MDKGPFISVRSEEDRDKLLKLGFTFIEAKDGLYTFLNDSHKWKQNYNNDGVKAIVHNKLSI